MPTTAVAPAEGLAALPTILAEVVGPLAEEIDRTGVYPNQAIQALSAAGLLGLISATEVGGLGQGQRAAADVVEQLARHCGSTAMVVMMHYSAVAVIEALGPEAVRRDVAGGRALASLAFSEAGSRSHFWAPVSTATAAADGVFLDARKSWVTSAGEADLYVWSSQPLAADGPSTLWLVPADAPGLELGPPFDGLGLRGNCSRPVTANGTWVPSAAMLGTDGSGFDTMLGVVLPCFQVLSAAFSAGTMDVATTKAAAHATATRFEHLDQSLAENPVVRASVARMRIRTDSTRTLLSDTLTAIETGRDDTMLRVLEVKAAASEAAMEVTDLAMRVCGGAAFRKEIGVERHFRDARASSVMAPTTEALHDFIGKAVCGLPIF